MSADARRLFDVAVRLQLYVEGVKVNQSAEFGDVVKQVNDEFKKLLSRVEYDTLDNLSKVEINKLVARLRQSQSKIYKDYIAKLINQLVDFMQADLTVNRILFASLHSSKDDETVLTDKEASQYIEEENKRNAFIPLFGIGAILLGSKKLWSRIANDPIAANGVLLNPFLTSFSVSAQLSIENLIRKGYANGWNSKQLSQELDLQLRKVANQADAVISTTVQHISANVSNAVQSALYGKYQWISVIDSGTTDICLSRNGKIYAYISGPKPPAHIRCRSTTVPYLAKYENETFYSWIKRQPVRTQNFALGKALADMLRSGKLKAKDLVRLSNPSPMTIEQFRRAGVEILTGGTP